MKNNILIVTILIIAFAGIYGLFIFIKKINFNSQSILERGNVVQNEFKEEIPFQLENGWSIIPASIGGKTYRFIFDTGALNVVSFELAKELNLKKVGSSNATSSTGESQSIELVSIPKIEIGNIEFENTTTAIIDIKNQFKCYQIDGLIGSNLMKNAIWQVNNKDKKIIFTDNIDKLNLIDFKESISFSTNAQYNPYLNLKFADTKIISLFDTGHNGKALMNKEYLKEIPQSIMSKKIQFRGNSSQGVFTESIDTTSITSHIKFDVFNIDNSMNFKDHIVTFTKGDSKIGNSFFSNYDYIIDWNQKKIFLKKFKEKKIQQYISYGFGKSYDNNLVTVGELMIDSEASKILKSGDQILEFNGSDWSNLSQDEWCSISENPKWPDELMLKIKRGNSTKDIIITKETFIQ